MKKSQIKINNLKKKENEKAANGDQVLLLIIQQQLMEINLMEAREKVVQLELGKNLFLKGFDEQLIGVKKNDTKLLDATLPANHPKKELANKKTKFECKILNVKNLNLLKLMMI